MGTSVILAIVGGVVGVITIIAQKNTIYIDREADGDCHIVIGMLDKPLPINKEE